MSKKKGIHEIRALQNRQNLKRQQHHRRIIAMLHCGNRLSMQQGLESYSNKQFETLCDHLEQLLLVPPEELEGTLHEIRRHLPT